VVAAAVASQEEEDHVEDVDVVKDRTHSEE
jgi:hypothetical protein